MEYEKPMDTTEQIAKSGKIVWLNENAYYQYYLKTSVNEWQRKVGHAAQLFTTKKEMGY